ncbi:MAG: hypothetical protein K2P51_04465 [Rhabdochlamydiaceae bacterium]|nr:hypothetical protein [Rhabdochlamydiaceae bacterium]
MTYVILLSFANVVSRSSLNIIDRLVFSRSKTGFLRLYLYTNALPLAAGILLLPPISTIHSFFSLFTTIPCFLLALSTQLVGMSFSYAFRHCEVRHVIIKAKIPELLFVLVPFIPFAAEAMPQYTLGLGVYCSLIATSAGLIILFLQKKSKILSLFDKAGYFIIGSLVIQMTCSSMLKMSNRTWSEIIQLTVAMLLWRCCLTLPMLLFNENASYLFSWLKKDQLRIYAYRLKKRFFPATVPPQNLQMERLAVASGQTEVEKTDLPETKTHSSGYFGLLSLRAILALITQLTFTWCILEGPLWLIWPIINTTPLISSIASQFILKEKPLFKEIVALFCFFISSTCTVFL